MNYILKDTNKDFRKKYFYSFDCSCVYDIIIINITNNKEVVLTIKRGHTEFKFQLHGLSKKINNARKNGFIH